MPTYEYLCQSCGARFEAWQKMTDDPIDTCPTCGHPVRRIIFPVGLVFKGSGFYINDTRAAGGASKPAPDGNTASETSSSESAGAGSSSASETPSTGDSAGTAGKAPAGKEAGTTGTAGT